MLIGLCGALCAGKASIADYLVAEHGFQRVRLAPPPAASHPVPVPEPVPVSAPTSASEPVPASLPPTECITFPTAEALLDWVTLLWQDNWVTTDVWDESIAEVFFRRPFFLLIAVDAPIIVRWRRYQDRCLLRSLPAPALLDFIACDDAHRYAPGTGLASLFEHAQLKLLNSTSSLASLRAALASLNLTSQARLRPSWDQYFMQLADLAAHRCNCMKRRVGCVIVRENRVISTGYNGTPRGMTNCQDGGCPRCNAGSKSGTDLSACLCLHAEENALLEAGRDRIGDNAILYCNTCPCLTCSVKIAQVGICEVVYNRGYLVDTQTAAIFAESGVRLRQFSPPVEGVVDLSSLVD